MKDIKQKNGIVDQPEQQGQVLPRYAQMPSGVPGFIGLEPRKLGEAVSGTFQKTQK